MEQSPAGRDETGGLQRGTSGSPELILTFICPSSREQNSRRPEAEWEQIHVEAFRHPLTDLWFVGASRIVSNCRVLSGGPDLTLGLFSMTDGVLAG